MIIGLSSFLWELQLHWAKRTKDLATTIYVAYMLETKIPQSEVAVRIVWEISGQVVHVNISN